MEEHRKFGISVLREQDACSQASPLQVCKKQKNQSKKPYVRSSWENLKPRPCRIDFTISQSIRQGLSMIQTKFRRRTSHGPNRMQMSKILCSPSFAFDSAHVKYGVWTGPDIFPKRPQSYAKFRRRTWHEPNRMQMRKVHCSPSFTFDSARHVMYGVWTWPYSWFK